MAGLATREDGGTADASIPGLSDISSGEEISGLDDNLSEGDCSFDLDLDRDPEERTESEVERDFQDIYSRYHPVQQSSSSEEEDAVIRDAEWDDFYDGTITRWPARPDFPNQVSYCSKIHVHIIRFTQFL